VSRLNGLRKELEMTHKTVLRKVRAVRHISGGTRLPRAGKSMNIHEAVSLRALIGMTNYLQVGIANG
jgi:hypothetical protein